MASGGDPPEEIKRLGRGAALTAILKKAAKPTLPSESEKTCLTNLPIGRASFMQTFLGRGTLSSSETSPSSPQFPGVALGRANLALGRAGLLKSSSSSSSSPIGTFSCLPSTVGPSSTFSASSGSKISSTPSPLIEDFEKLSIGEYSGEGGKPLQLEVNYLRLNIVEGKGVFEYHVSFKPIVDSRSLKFRIIKQPEVQMIIGSIRSFDGAKLYLPIKLDPEVSINTTLPTDGSNVLVHIKFISRTRQRDMLHLYNVLFRKIMSELKMVQIGRNYFDPSGNIPVPQHKLEIWPGYITAVQEYEGGIMLNADSSFRVLRSVTARDVMTEASHRRNNMKEDINRLLVGSTVLTRYNNKNYRIDDISWDTTPRSTFNTHDGREISFVEYYKNAYDIDIIDDKQPLLLSRPKKRGPDAKETLICLVPELCYMTGLTDQMRADHHMMRDIATHTRVTPAKRQFCFQNFIKNITKSPKCLKILNDWNLELDDGFVSLEGRHIGPEKLIMKKATCVIQPQADWGREITNNECLVAVSIEKWFIVYTKRDASKVNEFIGMYKKIGPSMGIKVGHPIPIELGSDRTDQYCDALRRNISPAMQLAVAVFPNPRDDRYSAVKKVCCLEKPIPSQCINVRTISQTQKLRSVTQKIALQINCKVGGELWSLPIPLENIMVCGLDTYHDAAQKNKSILGFVSSINRSLTRWFNRTASQKAGQELGDALRVLFLSALRKYHEVNHKLPQRIFIYRDGVGDGMLDTVGKYEVDQLNSCFKNIQSDYKPSLSVIVVQKRINTRMYLKTNGNLNNPPPGSVLDHSVTRKGVFDFFLVSQHVGQGTVTPTHYVVVHNTNTDIKCGHMQRLSYKLTHLYYNWPGTVRVPAPCQYAHKMAYLVGQNLHNEAHEDLADRLYFL